MLCPCCGWSMTRRWRADQLYEECETCDVQLFVLARADAVADEGGPTATEAMRAAGVPGLFGEEGA
jgi:hypothetical protein